MQKYGRTFERTADGGWLEQGAELPDGSTARICGESIVMREAALRPQLTGGRGMKEHMTILHSAVQGHLTWPV